MGVKEGFFLSPGGLFRVRRGERKKGAERCGEKGRMREMNGNKKLEREN